MGKWIKRNGDRVVEPAWAEVVCAGKNSEAEKNSKQKQQHEKMRNRSNSSVFHALQGVE